MRLLASRLRNQEFGTSYWDCILSLFLLCVLAALSFPIFHHSQARAREAAAKQWLREWTHQQALHCSRTFPVQVCTREELLYAGLPSADLNPDPDDYQFSITNSDHTWIAAVHPVDRNSGFKSFLVDSSLFIFSRETDFGEASLAANNEEEVAGKVGVIHRPRSSGEEGSRRPRAELSESEAVESPKDILKPSVPPGSTYHLGIATILGIWRILSKWGLRSGQKSADRRKQGKKDRKPQPERFAWTNGSRRKLSDATGNKDSLSLESNGVRWRKRETYQPGLAGLLNTQGAEPTGPQRLEIPVDKGQENGHKTLDEFPVEFYRCVISHNSKDGQIVRKIYEALGEKGVQAWFAPVNLQPGQRFRQVFNLQIQKAEKVLVFLSKNSIRSQEVAREVRRVLQEEVQTGREIVFPIRLDDAISQSSEECFKELWEERHIFDFQQWEDEMGFKEGIVRLTRHLEKAKAPRGQAGPGPQ